MWREKNGREFYIERVMVLKRGKCELGREKRVLELIKELGTCKKI